MSRTLYILRMSNSPDPVSAASVRAPLVDAATPVASTPWSRLAPAMCARPGLLIVLGVALAAAGRPLLWMNVLIIPVDVVTLLLVHRLLRAEGRGLADLLRPVRGGDIAWGLLCGLIVVLAWFPASFIAGLVAYRGPMPTAAYQSVPLWIALVGVTIMPVTIGLAEETLYRGYLQPRLAGVLGQARAVIAASAFFAVQHIAFAPFDPRAMVFGIVRTFLAGLVFAGLFLWRRRVMPLAVGHWLVDLLGLGLPLLLAALA